MYPQVIASWDTMPQEFNNNEKLVGGKALGLLRLPKEWVPPFIVLTLPFFETFLQIGDATKCLDALPMREKELLVGFMRMINSKDASKHLLVRSNAPCEDLNCRGKFFSIPVNPILSEVGQALNQILNSSDPNPMCVILQAAIEPGVLGHMSNERRVSQKRTHWLVEGLGIWGPSSEATYIEAARATSLIPLMASDESGVSKCLRSVARYLNDLNHDYFHCEWVWSSRRLWIVQCDKVYYENQDSDLEEYLRSKTGSVTSLRSLPFISHFSEEGNDRWKKLNRPKTFATLHLPVADIFVISGDKWNNLGNRQGIVASIDKMCQICPVVVRCDISQEAKIAEILLPTSSPTQKLDELLNFMEKTAQGFAEKNVASENWAFLLAFLVPARASAMVHARPKSERVRVDTNWGFPDGLSFFPHDSWFYYPADGHVKEKRRFKGSCLMPDQSGWVPKAICAPFDWQPVLNESEVKTVAIWALQLANHLDHEVQLMALARIGNKRGPEGCLPWHYTEWEVPRFAESMRMLPRRSALEVISSWDDLDILRRCGDDSNIRGYYVRPVMDLLRNNLFLESAAQLATSKKKPIYFEGSVLGHAYYVMARAGAAVIPINEDEPEDKDKYYHKLVRDNIPMIIHRAGGLARVRHVSHSEAQELLRQKLIEEAFEVRSCLDSQLIEELADVLEVVDGLRSNSGIPVEELDRIRHDKRTKRGGFDQAVYLESTGLVPLRLNTDTEGRLPLFRMEEVISSKRRRSLELSQISNLPIENDNQLLRLSISLIPPVTKAEQPIRIVFEPLDATIEVRYTESKVFVTITRIPKSEPESQLSLFPNLI